jgi:hypothetical protein
MDPRDSPGAALRFAITFVINNDKSCADVRCFWVILAFRHASICNETDYLAASGVNAIPELNPLRPDQVPDPIKPDAAVLSAGR